MAVFSVMILLSKEGYPGPGHNILREEPFGHFQHHFQYHEIRLWEVDPATVLESGSAGLIPLAALMKGEGQTPLDAALAAAKSVPDNIQRADAITAIAVLGNLRYQPDLLKSLIRRDMMKESVIYQEIFEEGLEKGLEKGRVEGFHALRRSILGTLRKRFGEAAAELSQQLEAIASFERLEELVQQASLSEDLEAFRASLK